MGFKKTFKKTTKKVKSINKTVVAVATPVLSLASNLPSPYGETAKSAGDIVAMDAKAVSVGEQISGAFSGGSSSGSGGSSFGSGGSRSGGSGGYASAPYSPSKPAKKDNDSGGFFAWFFGLFGF